MKIKLKQVNRGLVLAAVLALGTAGYVVVQNVQFKNNIPELKDSAEQFCREMVESNIGSGEGVRRKQRAFVQNSFTEGEGSAVSLMSMGTTMTKRDLLYELGQPYTADGEVIGAEFEQISADVKKSGATGANVKIEYKLSFDCEDTPELLTFAGIDTTEYYCDPKDMKGRKNFKCKGKVNLYMLLDDGEWKIASVSSDGGFNWDVEYLDDDSETEDDEGGEPVE